MARETFRGWDTHGKPDGWTPVIRHNRERVKSKARIVGGFRYMGKALLSPAVDSEGRGTAEAIRAFLGEQRGSEFVGKHMGRTVIGFHESPGVGSLRYE